jgi:hypothetical protein
MRRSIVVLLAAIAAGSPFKLVAAVTLPAGLAPGSKYQLVFVTADITPASNTDISYYNEFAQSEAAPLNSLLPPGVAWHAIASTATVDAFQNAQCLGVPIYNTAGQLVASAANGLYSETPLFNPIEYDQFGNLVLHFINNGNAYVAPDPYTGSNPDGSRLPGFTLGGSFGNGSVSYVGRVDTTTTQWLSFTANQGSDNPEPLYALSSAITVPGVPEPASAVLLACGAMAVAIAAVRKALRANRNTQPVR